MMQPVLTTAQSKGVDKHLIEEIGIPSLVLMENAAGGAVAAIEDWLAGASEIAVVCGTGNNGGDGLAIARLLTEREHNVTIFLAGTPEKLSPDARVQYDALSKLIDPDEVYSFETAEEIFDIVDGPDIVIDALLGTGSKGEPREAIAEGIRAINTFRSSSGAKVLAIDIPTGLDSDSGAASENVVIADRTVTMAAPKLGFYHGNARAYTGDIHIAPLGGSLPSAEGDRAFLVTAADLSIPPVAITSSKITRGRVLAICGSRGMTGAGIMSGGAALRSGCGMVTVALPESERRIVAQAVPELLTVGIAELDGDPAPGAWFDLQDHLERVDVVLIGCGLKPAPHTTEFVLKVIADVDKPMVIDGGALGALATNLGVLNSRKSPTILTPHVGELAKLVGRPWPEVERERIAVARVLVEKYGVIVVAKGAPAEYTVTPDRTCYINSSGNPGLATAGTGDVLAGMIASFLAQGFEASRAATTATYLHGLAGDFAATESTQHCMTATDVIAFLPQAFKSIGAK
ncbi:MAG: NAD(P)H-hydrate dehydratase [Bacteroidota bacterium]|nr:NAD(P)H-hydrate dehydratase [Bacteroidota bacterium]MDP4234075.1 NAD(P)H-hydrate dehydratase [Bacteroidota bacterium]MDP4243016.1 NAD(P)H-hydrate dehydratase [Bacteroidota bacterium]MDP4287442.1 NAD(P)H-hydrate dehydratase [Bacteroidota bacterium]